MNPLLGLMFYRKTPVAFYWKTPGLRSIHSLLCRRFLARWYCKGVLVEERIIEPNQFRILPIGEFDELIEVPIEEYKKEENIE